MADVGDVRPLSPVRRVRRPSPVGPERDQPGREEGTPRREDPEPRSGPEPAPEPPPEPPKPPVPEPGRSIDEYA